MSPEEIRERITQVLNQCLADTIAEAEELSNALGLPPGYDVGLSGNEISVIREGGPYYFRFNVVVN